MLLPYSYPTFRCSFGVTSSSPTTNTQIQPHPHISVRVVHLEAFVALTTYQGSPKPMDFRQCSMAPRLTFSSEVSTLLDGNRSA